MPLAGEWKGEAFNIDGIAYMKKCMPWSSGSTQPKFIYFKNSKKNPKKGMRNVVSIRIEYGLLKN